MTAAIKSGNRYSLLYRILKFDGIFALISGLILIIGHGPIAALFDLDQPLVLLFVGIVVFVYGLALLILGRRDSGNRFIGTAAVTLNMLWVIVSYLGLLLGWWTVNTAGKWAIALVAEVVLVFAIIEIIGLRKIIKRKEDAYK